MVAGITQTGLAFAGRTKRAAANDTAADGAEETLTPYQLQKRRYEQQQLERAAMAERKDLTGAEFLALYGYDANSRTVNTVLKGRPGAKGRRCMNKGSGHIQGG